MQIKKNTLNNSSNNKIKLEKHIAPTTNLPSSCTFDFILNEWIKNNSIRNKKSTEDKYKRLINQHIIPELGGYILTELTSERINFFLNQKLNNGRLDKKGGLSPSYVRTIAIIIKSALNYAESTNCCFTFKPYICMPQPEKKEYKILSDNSFQRFYEYLTTNISPVHLGILLSLCAGLRIGEVCAIKWKNIDTDARIIHITSTITRISNSQNELPTKTIYRIDNTKTFAGTRNIPIVSNLIEPLEQLKNNKSCYILTGTEDFMSPRTYENKFHKALRESGIEPINYHILRHTFATRCVQKGVDIKSLSEFLGHADVTTTLKTYVHSTLEQKLIEIEKISI